MISIVFIFMGVVTTLQYSLYWRKHTQVSPKGQKNGKKEKSSGSSWNYLSAKTAFRPSLLLPPEVSGLGLLPPRAVTRCLKCAYREHNSERGYSPMSHNSPIPLRPTQADAEIEEQIRQRAYELYQARGGVGGNATDDWQQAKEEVLSHKAKSATTSS